MGQIPSPTGASELLPSAYIFFERAQSTAIGLLPIFFPLKFWIACIRDKNENIISYYLVKFNKCLECSQKVFMKVML